MSDETTEFDGPIGRKLTYLLFVLSHNIGGRYDANQCLKIAAQQMESVESFGNNCWPVKEEPKPVGVVRPQEERPKRQHHQNKNRDNNRHNGRDSRDYPKPKRDSRDYR